jgi:hypothetical protein
MHSLIFEFKYRILRTGTLGMTVYKYLYPDVGLATVKVLHFFVIVFKALQLFNIERALEN